MTVKELIHLLEKLPQNSEVFLNDYMNNGSIKNVEYKSDFEHVVINGRTSGGT